MAGRASGFALFLPSGQQLAQARESDSSRAVGLFSAMLMIPPFYGTALGQWSLHHWGEAGFFPLPVLPLADALLLIWGLPRTETPAPPILRAIRRCCAIGSCGCLTPRWASWGGDARLFRRRSMTPAARVRYDAIAHLYDVPAQHRDHRVLLRSASGLIVLRVRPRHRLRYNDAILAAKGANRPRHY